MVQLHVLLPLGLVLPGVHLFLCRQEGPEPQEAQGAPEAQQPPPALGLPGRDEAWHDPEREGRGPSL